MTFPASIRPAISKTLSCLKACVTGIWSRMRTWCFKTSRALLLAGGWAYCSATRKRDLLMGYTKRIVRKWKSAACARTIPMNWPGSTRVLGNGWKTKWRSRSPYAGQYPCRNARMIWTGHLSSKAQYWFDPLWGSSGTWIWLQRNQIFYIETDSKAWPLNGIEILTSTNLLLCACLLSRHIKTVERADCPYAELKKETSVLV